MTECECSVREEKRTPCQFLKFLSVILTGLVVCAFMVIGAVMVSLFYVTLVLQKTKKNLELQYEF